MIKKSRQLALDDVSAGMVLADDLMDKRAGMLLPQGTPLTEEKLKLLRDRRVTTVPAISIAEYAAELARREQRLARLFRLTPPADADDANAQLLQYLRHFHLGETA
jgi:hypothetical protein